MNVHNKVCQLCSLVYESVHSGAADPGASKLDVALFWVWGRSMIALFGCSRITWQKRWAARLAEAGLDFARYSIDRLRHPCCVYIKVSHKHSAAYCGMTAQGMIAREAARARKYRQAGLTSAEPAVRWWQRTGTFFHYVPLVFSLHAGKHSAEVAETRTLDRFKFSLNMPHVAKLVKYTKQFKARALVDRPPGRRLWARARRLQGRTTWVTRSVVSSASAPLPTLRGAGQPEFQRADCWGILHRLGDRAVSSFKTERKLRSHSTSTVDLYFLFRLSNALEEPKRGRVRAKLTRAMQYKGLLVPRPAQPLRLGSLRHGSFVREARAFARKLLRESKDGCIPLHIPTGDVVETRWRSVQECLHNFRPFTRGLVQGHVAPCVCERYKNILPAEAWSADGHVAARGSILPELSTAAQAVAAGNARETIFPSRKRFEAHALSAFKQFFHSNQITAISASKFEDAVRQWARAQWETHVREQAQGGLTDGALRELKENMVILSGT